MLLFIVMLKRKNLVHIVGSSYSGGGGFWPPTDIIIDQRMSRSNQIIYTNENYFVDL